MTAKAIDLEALKLFAILMETGSFTQTAEVVGSSKSHVSKTISKLESHLGYNLIHRTTRRLGLTAAGETLLPFAQELLQLEHNTLQAIHQLEEAVAGPIKLSMPVSLGETVSHEILWPFCQKFPQVEIEVDLSNSFYDLISEGIDLAIRGGKIMDDRLVVRPLFGIQELLCATANYLEIYGKPQTPDDLANHSCLVSTRYDKRHEWLFFQGQKTYQVTVKGHIASNHYHVLKKATLASMGIARLPFYLITQELRDQQLVSLLPEYHAPQYPAYLVYPSQGLLPKRIRVLIEHIQNWFESNEKVLNL